MNEAEKLITAWAWTRQAKAEYEAEQHRYDYDLNTKLLAVENAMMVLARKLEARKLEGTGDATA